MRVADSDGADDAGACIGIAASGAAAALVAPISGGGSTTCAFTGSCCDEPAAAASAGEDPSLDALCVPAGGAAPWPRSCVDRCVRSAALRAVSCACRQSSSIPPPSSLMAAQMASASSRARRIGAPPKCPAAAADDITAAPVEPSTDAAPDCLMSSQAAQLETPSTYSMSAASAAAPANPVPGSTYAST